MSLPYLRDQHPDVVLLTGLDMSARFDRVSDILAVKRGDKVSRTDRFKLFTGSEVGNTPQKGINWLGTPPNYLQVIARCSLHSGYSDRWIDEDAGIFLYHLMVTNRGTDQAIINYKSKENAALIEQRNHGAPVLLMIDEKGYMLGVHGRFEVVTLCHDNPIHPGVDSVLLRRISD